MRRMTGDHGKDSQDPAKHDINNNEVAATAKNKKVNEKKVAKSNSDTKEVRKLFDSRMKAGDPHGINVGLTIEQSKKWFLEAKLIDKDFGITEEAFTKAFEQVAKCEDKSQVEFLQFIECLELLAKEISKEPQDFYNKLLEAEKQTAVGSSEPEK